jgi:Skp family chaperone for outer membrane proteins
MKTLQLLSVFILLCASSSLAQTNPKAAKNSHYLVQSPHTQEQCMNVMEEMKSKGDQYLSKFYFGCMSGDHTAYAILEAPSEDAARKMLPKDVQQNARVTKVDKFTAAQIEKMHKEMH